MMNKIKILYLVVLLLAPSTLLWAQGNTVPDEERQNIIITKGERPISKSFKKSMEPSTLDTVIPVPETNYPLIPKQVETGFELKPLQPAFLKIVEPLNKLYKGYVRAGFGSNLTTLIDGYYSSGRSRSKNLGIMFKHHGSNGGVKDFNHSGFYENSLRIFGRKILDNHVASAEISYKNDLVHWYGINEKDTLLDKALLKQRFQELGVKGKLVSRKKDSSEVNYTVNAGYNYYFDLANGKNLNKNYQASEHRGVIDANLFKFHNKEFFKLDAELDYNRYITSRGNCNECLTLPEGDGTGSVILKLEPAIITQAEKYMVRVGLGIHGEFSAENKFRFYPQAEAMYKLFDDILIPHVGITGGVKRNSFTSISTLNPYVNSEIELKNTKERLRFYAGLRGTLSQKTSFNLQFSRGQLNDYLYFINNPDRLTKNQFEVKYDSLSYTEFSGQITVDFNKKLKVLALGKYSIFSSKSQQQAWYRPSYQISLTGNYNLYKKLITKLEVYMQGGRKAPSYAPVNNTEAFNGIYSVDLRDYVDANLSVEYRYTSKLSGFLMFNNFLGKRYATWYNYHNQGITVVGGVTYSF